MCHALWLTGALPGKQEILQNLQDFLELRPIVKQTSCYKLWLGNILIWESAFHSLADFWLREEKVVTLLRQPSFHLISWEEELSWAWHKEQQSDGQKCQKMHLLYLSILWTSSDICDIENSTNISRIVSAGDGEVDDVLVGGGEQGDEEEAENEQDPSEAGVLPVAHICYRFTNNPSWVWPWLATLTLPWPE